MNEAIFKAYDVRGKVGSELNAESCQRIGRAFADWLPLDGPVAVGYDMRPDSKELAEAVAEGLRLQGREVWSIGQVASDMLYFAVGSLEAAGGAMITASHNPGEYNGIKFCREQAKGVGIETGLAEIRDLAVNNDFAPSLEKAPMLEKNVMDAWVQHALNFVNVADWPAYKIAADAGNGMAGAVLPYLVKHLPEHVQVTPMYWELDGTFPNHLANPLDRSTLVALQAKIKDEGLDFGLAFDGDGDRAALLDENGQPMSGTVMTAILAQYFLKKNPGATVLYNAICGRVVKETIADAGGNGVRTKVGHSFIKGDMRTHDAVFAGEHSGHYYFRDNYSADSGLIAALVAIQVLAESGKKLSELIAEFDDVYVSIEETNFEVTDKEGTLARLQAEFQDGTQDDLDGLTVNYADSWFNVRPSNTEPLLRLNAEAKDKAMLDELVAKVTAVIKG